MFKITFQFVGEVGERVFGDKEVTGGRRQRREKDILLLLLLLSKKKEERKQKAHLAVEVLVRLLFIRFRF